MRGSSENNIDLLLIQSSGFVQTYTDNTYDIQQTIIQTNYLHSLRDDLINCDIEQEEITKINNIVQGNSKWSASNYNYRYSSEYVSS